MSAASQRIQPARRSGHRRSPLGLHLGGDSALDAARMARLEAKAVAKQKATILRDQARHERVTNRTRQPMYSQASDPRFQL